MNEEPQDNYCDECGKRKQYFESCNSDYCEGCKKVLLRETKIFVAEERYHKINFCSLRWSVRCGPVRKYRICIDCSEKSMEE